MKPALLLSFLPVLFAGCRDAAHQKLQGYVEGEFLYVASPFAGALETLSVQRGTQVQKGAPLYSLEHGAEKAAEEQAAQRVEEAEARLSDARKGMRTSEIAAMEAQVGQAEAALSLSEREYQRQSVLAASHV